jgi:hypothetical protein
VGVQSVTAAVQVPALGMVHENVVSWVPLEHAAGVLHAMSQHTPSGEQKVLAHMPPLEQVWPFLDLQTPPASQVCMPVQLSGSSMLRTFAQRPPAPHISHLLQEAVPQQTLSTQKPLLHSVPLAQPTPGSFSG